VRFYDTVGPQFFLCRIGTLNRHLFKSTVFLSSTFAVRLSYKRNLQLSHSMSITVFYGQSKVYQRFIEHGMR